MTHIITDCDGVLLDWNAGFRAFMQNLYGDAAQLKPDDLPMAAHDSVFEWAQAVYGADRRVTWSLLEEFQVSDEFSRLPAYPDALEFIPRLRRELGFQLTIVSTAGASARTRELRLVNLDVFGADIFTEVVLLPLGMSKAEELRRFESAPWFDDHVHHVMCAHEIGHLAYHFDRYDVPDVRAPRRISSWEAVYLLAKTKAPADWAVAAAV